MFKENHKILNFYQEKFKYTLVDEYQDTNAAQYLLLRLLTEYNKNICCVGDEDQSIYGWRGAQLKNILNFEKDFDNSQIIRLEQNYRSTGNILKAASSLISENKERIGKISGLVIKTENLFQLIILRTTNMRQFFIAKKIQELNKKMEYLFPK